SCLPLPSFRDQFPRVTPSADEEAITEQIRLVSVQCGASAALIQNETILSYRELDDKADRFANYLVGLGVVSGETVALCLERSFDWIVSALGIMRAGAAYVPLD